MECQNGRIKVVITENRQFWQLLLNLGKQNFGGVGKRIAGQKKLLRFGKGIGDFPDFDVGALIADARQPL